MYPMKLAPACKDYLWGGTRLKNEYGIVSNLPKVAESWELSCHKDGKSIITNGDWAGHSLEEYLEAAGNDVLGTHGGRFSYFPVLIKLIDAKENLSVQVHPNNEYAQRVEGEYGKTEMWYILDCEPGASLCYGFQHAITREEFRARIEDNTLLNVVNRVPVKKGDVFFIEAGTLHAIGAGIVIAEIQQNSNTTYRVYDYGRLGTDGKPRALHIDKALEVTSLTPPKRETSPEGPATLQNGYTQTLLSSCEYFTVHRLDISDSAQLTANHESFHSLLCTEGNAVLSAGQHRLTIKKGDSIFIPADLGNYSVSGFTSILLTTI